MSIGWRLIRDCVPKTGRYCPDLLNFVGALDSTVWAISDCLRLLIEMQAMFSFLNRARPIQRRLRVVFGIAERIRICNHLLLDSTLPSLHVFAKVAATIIGKTKVASAYTYHCQPSHELTKLRYYTLTLSASALILPQLTASSGLAPASLPSYS